MSEIEKARLKIQRDNYRALLDEVVRMADEGFTVEFIRSRVVTAFSDPNQKAMLEEPAPIDPNACCPLLTGLAV